MSTRKIRNSWWVDFRCGGVRYRKKSPENSRAGAAVYETMLRQRLTRGEPIDGRSQEHSQVMPSFEEFAATWYTTYVKTNNKASEQKSKMVTLKAHLIPFFGHMRLDEITSLKVEEYKAQKLKVGLAPKSVNNHLTILAKCLHTAEDWIELPASPKIKHLKVPPQHFDFLSPSDSQRLLDSIKDIRWYAMVLVALRTGLRLGELLGLEWSDIDLEAKLLTVRHSIVRGVVGPPKNNRERHVPLTSEVTDALVALAPSQGIVFYRRTPGHAMNHETPRKNLLKMCKVAGLRPIGWHVLRHTFASHLVAAGASLKAIQELLGHSDVRTTMRYAHLAPTALREAVALLDRSRDNKLPDFGQPVGNTRPVVPFPERKKALRRAFFPTVSMVAGVGIEPTK